jgi:hypothetical protein
MHREGRKLQGQNSLRSEEEFGKLPRRGPEAANGVYFDTVTSLSPLQELRGDRVGGFPPARHTKF